MSKVLVTGADGFIGSHLAEALVRRGHETRAMVVYNSFGSRGWLDHADPALVSEMEIVAGDVRDAQSVATAVEGCETVLNLAALIAIPYSYQAPESYIDVNIRGALNVLKAARANGAHVVQTSTSEVYGTAQRVPIDEDHPLNAQSPYAASKTGADQLALSFHLSFDMPVTVLRPFNTYGPRQSTRAVIPTIITQIAGGARTISLGALTPTRDFSFVADTAAGFIAAMETRGGIGAVINTGSGFEISIGDTASAIAEVMGVEIEIVSEAERMRPAGSEVERLFAANARARERLGWTPAYGGRDGFLRGLAETVEWYRDPTNLSRFPKGYAV